ncbi:hypothetical protein BX666DRAFT_1989118 [Dichotomocladium elegans]|nr:hypothetical protein BX666DRAFT_1989118 [Dichotomocladium elegans]
MPAFPVSHFDLQRQITDEAPGWSPFSKLRQMKSSWSLKSSWSTTPIESPESKPEAAPSTVIVPNNAPEPPTYDDPSHPWSSSHIEHEDEDVDNILPAYECTVSRAGQVYVKREKEKENIRSRSRSWRNLYVVLWGTCVQGYKRLPKRPDEAPVWSYSMGNAEVGIASDYCKYPHVVRVRLPQGPQFLMRCSTETDAILWIDALQASVNLCDDLDIRPMPEFAFRRRRRTRIVNNRTEDQNMRR